MKTSFIHILVLLFLLLTGTAATDEPSTACCPDGFMTLAGRCLFIAAAPYNSGVPPRSWIHSRNLCTAFMADSDTWYTDLIASLDVDFLSTFSAYIVDKLPELHHDTLWIGVHKVDGVWQWLDGSPISNMSYIWSNGYPITNTENKYGKLLPSGGYHRYYIHESLEHDTSLSFVCEAKKRTA